MYDVDKANRSNTFPAEASFSYHPQNSRCKNTFTSSQLETYDTITTPNYHMNGNMQNSRVKSIYDNLGEEDNSKYVVMRSNNPSDSNLGNGHNIPNGTNKTVDVSRVAGRGSRHVSSAEQNRVSLGTLLTECEEYMNSSTDETTYMSEPMAPMVVTYSVPSRNPRKIQTQSYQDDEIPTAECFAHTYDEVNLHGSTNPFYEVIQDVKDAFNAGNASEHGNSERNLENNPRNIYSTNSQNCYLSFRNANTQASQTKSLTQLEHENKEYVAEGRGANHPANEMLKQTSSTLSWPDVIPDTYSDNTTSNPTECKNTPQCEDAGWLNKPLITRAAEDNPEKNNIQVNPTLVDKKLSEDSCQSAIMNQDENEVTTSVVKVEKWIKANSLQQQTSQDSCK